MQNSDSKHTINAGQLTVAFFVRHFTERGTEVSVYNYADNNEKILGNKSIIIALTEDAKRRLGMFMDMYSFDRFNERFTVVLIDDIAEISPVIEEYSVDFFYTQTHGGNDIYQFDNQDIWGDCKTVKHCVFDTQYPESDFYISISAALNEKNDTDLPVLPYIVDYLPKNQGDLRQELDIPQDAHVFGRYGGITQFNIPFVHKAIKSYLESDSNAYFLFMNTEKFYDHPQIIYLDKSLDLVYKSQFIETCDAMIHAREMGETFGLAVAEFSNFNKPIITCNCGDIEHLKILGERALIYQSEQDLLDIFNNFEQIVQSRTDWNAYEDYTAERVMAKFNEAVFLR